MQISRDQREQIKKRQAANILAKLNAGKTISAREQRILDEFTGTGEVDFAKNWPELANLLSERTGVSITRRAIQNWRKDPRYAKHYPTARADGSHPVQAWMLFIERFGLKGSAEKGSSEPDERDIRLAHAQLRLERERFEFEQVKERMLPVAQFEIALSKTMAAFLAALNAFAPRINEQLEGLDFDDRSRLIEQEIELLRKKLASCDYLSAEEDEPDDE